MAETISFSDDQMAFLEQIDKGDIPETMSDEQMNLWESYNSLGSEDVNSIQTTADLIPDKDASSSIFDRIGLLGKELAFTLKPELRPMEMIAKEGIGKVAKEAGIGLAKGGMGIHETVSQNMNYVGRLLRIGDEKLKPLVDMGIINPAKAKTAKLLSDNLIKYGEKWTKHWQGEKAFVDKFRDKETWEGTFTDNFSISRTIASVAQTVPMFCVGAIGGAATGSAWFGASILGSAEGLDVFQEALDKNKSDARALTVGAITGVASTVGEMVFGAITDVISPNAKSVLNSMWKEATQEGGQQVVTNIIRKLGIDNTVSLFEGFSEAVIVGGLTGGAMTGLANTTRKRAIETAKKELSREEFEASVQLVENTFKENAEGINKAFETHVDDFVAANDKQAEQAQAEQQKKEAEQPKVEKTTKLAKRESENLFKKYDIEISSEDLAKYEVQTNEEQLNRAMQEFDKDPIKANLIALGIDNPSKGILPTSYYVIAEKLAIKNKDIDMLQKLATQSAISTEASKAGQLIQILSKVEADSPVRAVQEVAKVRTENFNKTSKEKADVVVKKEKNKVNKTIEEAYNSLDLEIDNFIKSLEC